MILSTKLRLCYKLSSLKHKFWSRYQSCPIILSTKIRGAKIQYANFSRLELFLLFNAYNVLIKCSAIQFPGRAWRDISAASREWEISRDSHVRTRRSDVRTRLGGRREQTAAVAAGSSRDKRKTAATEEQRTCHKSQRCKNLVTTFGKT